MDKADKMRKRSRKKKPEENGKEDANKLGMADVMKKLVYSQLASPDDDTVVHLQPADVAKQFGCKVNLVYTAFNVLEGILVVSKMPGKQPYQWNGFAHLPLALRALADIGRYVGLDHWMRKRLEVKVEKLMDESNFGADMNVLEQKVPVRLRNMRGPMNVTTITQYFVAMMLLSKGQDVSRETVLEGMKCLWVNSKKEVTNRRIFDIYLVLKSIPKTNETQPLVQKSLKDLSSFNYCGVQEQLGEMSDDDFNKLPFSSQKSLFHFYGISKPQNYLMQYVPRSQEGGIEMKKQCKDKTIAFTAAGAEIDTMGSNIENSVFANRVSVDTDGRQSTNKPTELNIENMMNANCEESWMPKLSLQVEEEWRIERELINNEFVDIDSMMRSEFPDLLADTPNEAQQITKEGRVFTELQPAVVPDSVNFDKFVVFNAEDRPEDIEYRLLRPDRDPLMLTPEDVLQDDEQPMSFLSDMNVAEEVEIP